MASYSDKNGKDKSARNTSKLGESYDAPFRGYINLQLSDEQKSTWLQWAASASVWEMLAASVSDGINISLKLDPKGTGYLASATQRRRSSPNAGLVVTARAKSAEDSFTRVLYCLAILGHQSNWTDTQPLADADRW